MTYKQKGKVYQGYQILIPGEGNLTYSHIFPLAVFNFKLYYQFYETKHKQYKGHIFSNSFASKLLLLRQK